jgi:hypothetical protein
MESSLGKALVKKAKHSSRWAGLGGTLITFGLIFGCGGSGPSTIPVTGEVAYRDGASLPLGGRVVFVSVSSGGEKGHTAKGQFSSDGKFQLTTFEENDGAVPGEYKVAVLPNVPDDRGSLTERAYAQALEPIDRKYLDPQTSGLRYTVSAENGLQPIRIAVTKPGQR